MSKSSSSNQGYDQPFSMEDLKDYLKDTNVITEAEELLFQSILKKSDERNITTTKTSSPTWKTSQADQVKTKENLNALKISDILQECENLFESNNSNKKVRAGLSDHLSKETQKEINDINSKPKDIQQILSSDLRNYPEIDLNELEKLANEEIYKLEQNKLNIQRKLEDQKLLLEREKLLNQSSDRSNNRSDQRVQNLSLANGKNLPLLDAATSFQLQQKLIEESKDFINKSSKQKAEILSSQRELALYKDMARNSHQPQYLMSKDTSYIKTFTQSPSKIDDSNDPILDAKIKNILQDLQNEDYLEEKRKQIEALRNIEEEKSRYESITLHDLPIDQRKKEKSIDFNNDPMQSFSMSQKKSLFTADGRVDRTIPITDFLDQWLNEEAHIQPAITSIPSSSSASTVKKNPISKAPAPVNGGVPSQEGIKDVFDQMNIPALIKNKTDSNNNSSYNPNNSPRYNSVRESAAPSSFISDNLGGNKARSAGMSAVNSNALPYYNQKYSVDSNYRHQQQQMQQPTFQNQQQFGLNPFNNNGQMPLNNPYGAPNMMAGLAPNNAYSNPQNPLVALQMQKLADQLEFENRALFQQYSQMNNPNNPNLGLPLGSMDPISNLPMMNPAVNPGLLDGFNNPLGGGMLGGLNPANVNANPLLGGNAGDVNNPYSLRRDNPLASYQKKELQKQDELRTLQYEIEKIKYQKQLTDLQTTFEKEKLLTQKELEYDLELEKQKHELQMIKMQQIIEKEKKLLELQQQQPQNKRSDDITKDNDLRWIAAHREESGVGLFPIPIELSKGVTVLIDGFVLPKVACQGSFYRIAIGIYDAQGKSLARLIATPWLPWSTSPITELPSSAGSSSGRGDNLIALEVLKAVILQSLKVSDLLSGNPTPEYLLGVKCLLELQVKDENAATDQKQQSLGYAVLPLFSVSKDDKRRDSRNSLFAADDKAPSSKPASASMKGTTPSAVLRNNAWKAVFRKGISDPLTDANTPPKLTDLVAPGNGAYFIVRIVDNNELLRASNWKVLIQRQMGLDEIQKFYLDPYDANSMIASEKPNNPLSLDFLPPGSRPATINNNNPLSRKDSDAKLAPFSPAGMNTMSSRPGSKLGMMSSKMMTSSKGKLETLEEIEDLEAPSSAMKRPASVLPTPILNSSNPNLNNNNKRKISSDNYWLMGNPLGPCNEKYQRGDGIDIYIDAARFLPDNCTVSRISLRFFTANKQMMGNTKVYSTLSQLSSCSIHPVYQLKAELRSGSSIQMNHSVIGLIRIDTVDSCTLFPATVGYAAFKVFAGRDRKAIVNTNDSNVYINTGCFQLPVYAGRVNPEIVESFTEDLLKDCGCVKIPCASLLIRIFSAPKASDGITTLSREDFPREEWIKLKLDYPLPDYSTGAYSGSLCEPSNNELLAFEAKSMNNPTNTLSCEAVLAQAMAATPNNSLPKRPADLNPSTSSGVGVGGRGMLKSQEQVDKELQYYESLFPSIENVRGSIEYNYTVPYHIDSGIAVNIHSLYNLPDFMLANQTNTSGGLFSGLRTTKSNTGETTTVSYTPKVICSISPPGLYYQDPPLSDNVYWSKTIDMNKDVRNPHFLDGDYFFYPAEMSFNLYLLLDVRTIRISTTTTVAPPAPTAPSTGNNEGENRGSENNQKMKLLVESDPVVTVENYLNNKKKSSSSSSSSVKSFWTLLPISCEKFPGNGFKYVSSGFYQLPLMEGSFPAISSTGGTEKVTMLKAVNMFEELLQRITVSNPTSNNGNFAKLSDGASVLVQCYNPLLNDFYSLQPSHPSQKLVDIFHYDRNKPNDNILRAIFAIIQQKNPQGNKDFEEEMGLGLGGGKKNKGLFKNPNYSLKLDQFKYTVDRYSSGGGGGGKTFQQLIPSSLTQAQFIKEINDYFLSATALHDY
eukprot:gene3161-3369_t